MWHLPKVWTLAVEGLSIEKEKAAYTLKVKFRLSDVISRRVSRLVHPVSRYKVNPLQPAQGIPQNLVLNIPTYPGPPFQLSIQVLY